MRILFFGTPNFATVSLKALISDKRFEVVAVVTQPDRAAGRGKQPNFSPVKTLALTHAIPVIQPLSIRKNLSAFIEELKAYGEFDVGVVVAFGQILPLEVLRLPRCGCVNVHASLLPRWRGAAPIQRAIMAGDSESGVALMQMAEGLDTGAVYASSSVKIWPETDSGVLHDVLAELGANLLISKLPAIATGELSAVEQSEVGVTYAQKIGNDECQINWNEPAHKIVRQILALAPVPGAFTTYKGLRLKVFKAQSVSVRHGLANVAPGAIFFQDSRTIEVGTGDGILALADVQLEGKKRMIVADFLRGINNRIESFGDTTIGSK